MYRFSFYVEPLYIELPHKALYKDRFYNTTIDLFYDEAL
jgi:hypothetical protein